MFRASCLALQFLVFLAKCLADPAPLAVPFNSTYFGPDGPWQAISVGVGGFDPTKPIYLQQTSVNLMPGGQMATFVLTPEACEHHSTETCGQGGLWTPTPTWDQTYSSIISPDIVPTPGLNIYNSTEYMVAITLQSEITWNVSVGAVTNATSTNSDGSTRPPELGWLALGGGDPETIFGNSSQQAPYTVWTVPGGLYNQGSIPSYSYGLHIGSAPLNFPGSLLFGGYDKSRTIGPYTSFDSPLQLLDVGIGVESGVSPFTFSNKDQLLVTDSHGSGPVAANPDPQFPYFHLPGNTCEAIADFLPVTYNSTSKYYLWDTEDPLYSKIVHSAAYLSLTFPPAPGGSANVTIKVLFMLLNLTLTPPLVSSPTPYFPCQPYELPPADAPNSYYMLGRAFLQAAFLGRNWQTSTSWLAQAPGPGLSNAGLGLSYTAIQPDDQNLDTFNNESMFAASWSSYWTQSPDDDPAATIVSSPTSGLSNGAKIGIGIGIGVSIAGLAAIGAIVFLFFRGRVKVKSNGGTEKSETMLSRCNGIDGSIQKSETPLIPHEMDSYRPPLEFPGDTEIIPELEAEFMRNSPSSSAKGRLEGTATTSSSGLTPMQVDRLAS